MLTCIRQTHRGQSHHFNTKLNLTCRFVNVVKLAKNSDWVLYVVQRWVCPTETSQMDHKTGSSGKHRIIYFISLHPEDFKLVFKSPNQLYAELDTSFYLRWYQKERHLASLSAGSDIEVRVNFMVVLKQLFTSIFLSNALVQRQLNNLWALLEQIWIKEVFV